MAAAGKKTKKQKWVKANITDIIAEPTTIPTTNSWADSVEEETILGHQNRSRGPVVLPSASRAARGGLAVDDESIPKRPPYIAHVSNLPYDVDDSAIADLFAGLKIANLRIPKEGDRLKGFGYVDFEDRESLVSAMNIPDLTVGGRRIRIEVYTKENDRRGMGRSGRSDRDRDYDPERTMGDWRSGPRAVPEPTRSRPMDRERDNRDRDRDRERDSSADNRPGGWRDGERAQAEPARTPYGGRDSYGRERYGERDRGFSRDGERSGYGGRDGFRAADRDGFSRDSRGFGNRGFGDRDRERDPPKEESKPRERPKLNLLPRTVPREAEIPSKPADGAVSEDNAAQPKPVPAEKVFGGAKPVDTAAKEREIEERLRKQEEDARRAVDEKERWGRRNDHSGDRRGGARRDDRSRDTRSYNRDRRDYSKDDKDRRDYPREDRDRRDYSRDDRDRQDSSRDDRDRQDSSRDDRDRQDYSRDDREKRDYSRDDRETRDYSREDREKRDHSRERHGNDYRNDRDNRSRERGDDYEIRRDSRDRSRDRPASREGRERSREETRQESNGDRDSGSRDRDRDRNDDDVKPLPKVKEQEKPNFIASNKFSFLEDADDGGSD